MLHIKLAESSEEIAAVEALFREYSEWCRQEFIRTGVLKPGDPKLNAFNNESLPGEYKFPTGFLLLALENSSPVGCMFLRKISEGICELKRFYIRPQYRGKAYAIEMLNAYCTEAKKQGYKKLRISSHPFQATAIDIYRRNRFYPIPEYLDDPMQSGDTHMELNLETFRPAPVKKSTADAEHYTWGHHCEGWRLLKNDTLAVTQERMPPGTAELLHYHLRSQQFFYIFSGSASFEIDGQAHILSANEGIHILPKVLHRVTNSGKDDLQFILVSEPAVQDDRVELIEYTDELKEPIKTLNYEWLEKYFFVEPGDVVSLSNPRKEILEKNGMIFYARWKGEIVGTASLLKVSDEEYELGKMAVTEKAQGQYIGNALIEHCLHQARRMSIKKLILYSNTSLGPAIHLYRKYGFAEVELERGHYERANIKMERKI